MPSRLVASLGALADRWTAHLDDEQCPDNHRCVAAKEQNGPGLCVPQCDALGADCADYKGMNGSCLVLKGVDGNTTQACAPCSANELCTETGGVVGLDSHSPAGVT